MLKIEIKTGGAAYSEDDVLIYEGRYELQRNLMDICRKITNGYDEGYIMDINGNKVGNWTLEDQQEIVIYLERGLTCMNELDRIIKDLFESIEDDQKYMEEEFEAVRDYCIKREFKLSEDEMKTIKSIGLEDWIEEWRSDYEEVQCDIYNI